MDFFYQKNNLKKSGDGPGGKFNGPKCKFIVSEEGVEDLEKTLPYETTPYILLLKSIRELHRVCVTSKFLEIEWKEALFNFETNFYFLYHTANLNMTLKNHILIHHYKFYFETKGKNFKDTNGEFGETLHYTLKKHEQDHGYSVKRKKVLLIIGVRLS